MFKRKLFKRALPVILSVAMIFQSTPATALAAENAETEAIVETAEGTEPSDDSSDAGSADSSEPSEVSPASEDAPTADGNSEEQAKEETEGQSTETAKVEESKNDESKAETAQTEESKEEGTSTEASKTEEAPSETVAENQGTETTTTATEESTEAVVEATSEVEADGETADVNAEQAALDTVIVVKDTIKRLFNNEAEKDEATGKWAHTSTYSNTDTKYQNIISQIEQSKNDYLDVKIDGESNTNLRDSSLTLKWEQKPAEPADAAWSELKDDPYPISAGNYRLVIAVKAMDGLCKDAQEEIYVTIKPIELEVAVGNVKATPGMTVAEFKAQVKEKYTLRRKGETADYGDKEKLVNNVTVTLKNAYDNTVIEDATEGTPNKLLKNVDYVMTIDVQMLDNVKANYTIDSSKIYNITIDDLVTPDVVITKNDAGQDITTVYNGKELTEKLVRDTIKSAKVVYKDPADGEDAEEKVISEKLDELTLEWFTKKIDLETGEADYNTPFEGTPKDAGEYYAKFKYAGELNLYNESYSEPIKVTIEPAPLVLKPTEAPELKAGMTMDEVKKELAKVVYKLSEIKTDAATGKETEADFTETKGFWGVSYNDKNVTEYYTPVFLIQYRDAVLDEDGKPVKEGSQIQYNEWADCKDNDVLQQTSEQIQYRIVFSGKKAVFNANGSIDDSIDKGGVDITDTTTMGAEKNYLVRVDEKTKDSTALNVEVGTAIATEIDVTEIIKSFQESADTTDKTLGTEENPLWKIYDDENPMFASRKAYKKAIVKAQKAGDTDPNCRDTAKELSYEWAYKTDSDSEYQPFSEKMVADWEQNEQEFLNTIKNVGYYRLRISYKDSNHTFLSATKDVIFEIRKQEVIIIPENFTARAGKTADDVTGDYWIYKLPNNKEDAESIAAFKKLSEEEKENNEQVISLDELFGKKVDRYDVQKNYLRVVVEQQKLNEKGEPIANEFGEMDDVFVDGENYNYRAYFYFEGIDSNYTNVNRSAITEESGVVYHQDWAEVDVKTIGAEQLEVIVDETKLPQSHVYGDTFTLADIQEAFTSGLFKIVLKNDHAQVVKPEELVNLGYYFAYRGGDRPDEKGYSYTQIATDAGTYYLNLVFEGNEQYADFDIIFDGNWDWQQQKFMPIHSFEITKRPLTITPKVVTDVIAAGERVDSIYAPVSEENPTIEGVAVLTVGEGEQKVTLIDDTQAFEYSIWEYGNSSFEGFLALNPYGPDDSIDWHDNKCLFTPVYSVDGESVNAYDHLKYGKTYQVTYEDELQEPYKSNYEVHYAKASYEVTARGKAQVESTRYRYGYDDNDNEMFTDSVRISTSLMEDGNGQIITPSEGIPFYYDVPLDGNKEKTNGNLFAFRIVAPKEYWDEDHNVAYENGENFIYKNSIENSDGYVSSDSALVKRKEENQTYYARYIDVLFDATNLKGSSKEFEICWENGYVEKFKVDFSNAELEADLREAVAPKSLSFNGVNTKMVVGEEQELDVKIVKQQLGDIISIGYRTNPENSDVITVDAKSGVVTALKVSTAAVEVQAYAYKLVDGEEVPFEKPIAKAKIKVADVTAPVIKKFENIRDNGAQINFTKVDNGYRRELYVLKGKATLSDFDTEIAKLEKGQATNFVITPIYNVEKNYRCTWDAKAKVYKYQLYTDSFTVDTEYSVYIRNVSVVRTLENGAVVEKSAKGTIKSFKTMKNQVDSLKPFFDETKTTVKSIKDDKTGEFQYYDVRLLDKSAQVSVYGYFKDMDTEAADKQDLREILLPVAKSQTNYLNPKLSYYIFDYDESDDESGYSDSSLVYYHKNGSLKQSEYATINNKGKITLKGVALNGAKKVRIVVVSDNDAYGGCTLRITAVPNEVKGKNAKMKVGDTIELYKYLDYKEQRKKVPNFRSSRLVIEPEERAKLEAAGFEIINDYNPEEEVYYPSKIRATAVAKNVELNVKDTIPYIDGTTGEKGQFDLTATIKLTVNALDGVKALKASYIDDQHITLNFTHAGNPSDFMIEVKDGRGLLVSKKLVNNSSKDIISGVNDYEQSKQQHIVDRLTYFEKTKTYAYTIKKETILDSVYGQQIPKIVKLSNYTITVTPMYNNTPGKSATKKVKTTNTPASYENLDTYSRRNGEKAYGGNYIYVTDNETSYDLWNNPLLTSGNAYTLALGKDILDYEGDWDGESPKFDIAQKRITDTLTWKSSNTKVATVKANAGTYTASLKAVKAGETDIEVISKITKKVIARYKVCVKPVSGGSSYYGEYEQGWFRQWDPLYTGKVEVLTLSNKVVVDNKKSDRDRTWVSFTAPAFGKYTFDANAEYELYSQKGSDSITSDWGELERVLEAGQQVYFKVYGNFEMSASGTEFAKLTIDAPTLNVDKEAWIAFVAPEDNRYTFKAEKGTIVRVRKNDNEQYVDESEYEIALNAGDVLLLNVNPNFDKGCTISVASREVTAKLVAGTESGTILTQDMQERWMTCEASDTGWYNFKITNTHDTDVKYYIGLGAGENEELDSSRIEDVREPETPIAKAFSSVFAKAVASTRAGEAETPEKSKTVRIWLNAGETLAIRICLSSNVVLKEDEVCTVKVKVTAPERKVLSMEKPVEVKLAENGGEPVWVSFVIPADGNYSFNAIDADGNGVDVEYYNESKSLITFARGEKILNIPYSHKDSDSDEEVIIKAGETIYLKVFDDATISVAELNNKLAISLTAGKPTLVEIGKNEQKWYTFKAPRAGKYTFSMDANVPSIYASGSLPTLEPQRYEEVGKTPLERFAITGGDSVTLPLEVNETVVFCLKTKNIIDDKKITGYIHVDANQTVQSLPADGSISVNNATDKSGVFKWYSYTIPAEGSYTFTWKSADGSGESKISFYDNGMGSGDLVATIENGGTNASLWGTKGNTIYIKVQQTTDTAVKGNLSVTVPTSASAMKLESGKEATGIELKQYRQQYFEFIAPKKAKYIVTATVTKPADASVYLMWRESYDSFTSNYETRVLEAGKKYTISAETYNETATINLLVKPVEPAALGNGNVEAVNGKPNWYEFSVTEPGRYNLNATPAQDNTINVEYYDSKFQRISSSKILGRYFEAGSIYVKASTSSETVQKATVKVEKTTIIPLKEGKDGNTIKMDANSNAFYEFKVQKTGTYVFTTKAADGKTVASSIGYTRNMENTYNTLYTGSPYSWFEVGDKIVIRMTSTEAADFTFMVEEKATELKVGTESEVKLGAYETAYFSFYVYKDGEYAFSAKDVTEGAVLDVDITDGNELITLSPKSGFYMVCGAHEKNKINFTVTNRSDKEVAFKAYAEYVKYNEDLTEANKLNVKVTKDKAQWIAFTAPESGRYSFKMADGVTMHRLHHYESDEGEEYWLEEVENSSDIPVAKDGRLRFCLTYNGKEESITTDVTVKNFEPVEIEEDAPFTVAKNSFKWFKYTASESGFYTFTLSDAQFVTDDTQEGEAETGKPDAEMYGYSYILQSDEDYDWDETSFEKVLSAGNTYYIKVLNNDNTDISAKLSVSQRIPMKLKVDEKSNIAVSIEENWCSFTAPETGTYKFQFTNNSYIEDNDSSFYFSVYQRLDDEYNLMGRRLYGAVSEVDNIFILGGTTLYFNLYHTSNIEDLNISILPTLSQKFELGDVVEGKVNMQQNVRVPSDDGNGKKFVKYKINQGDYYNWSMEAQSYFFVKLYKSGQVDYTFGDASYTNGVYSLDISDIRGLAGGDFVLEINTYDDSSVDVSILMEQQYSWE